MSWRARLERARLIVLAAVSWRITFTMLAAVAATVLVAVLLDVVVSIPIRGRAVVPWIATVVMLAVTIPNLWRARRLLSDQALALWIEEQQPLDYLLVTATDPQGNHPAVVRALDAVDYQPAVRRAAWRGTRDVTVFTAGLFVALAFIPAASRDRVLLPRAGDVLLRPRAPGSSRLEPIVARYTPPRYIGGEATTIEGPESVRGVEGGTVEILGPGSPAGLDASLGTRRLGPEAEGSSWLVRFDMPHSPAAFRIADGADDRLIALEPIHDSLPAVTLLAPVRDTVVKVASGRIGLRAFLTDDFGLAEGWFEYILSSGSGELFQFKSGRVGGTAGRRDGGTKVDSLTGVLDLDTLRMRPGDVLHIRAVARDLGPASRGTGASETRTYRVVRPTDLDTAAIVALPSMPGDTAALSERLLIQLTEALEARRPRLRRDVLLDESRSISRDQARLRRQVADVIFMRLSGEASAEEVEGVESDSALTPEALLAAAEAATGQGDTAALDFAEEESPVVAVNRPLLEAYNAMWDATRELDVAALTRALPHMYRALEAIQRARAAERVYLRAPAQRGVVNLAQVRLSGKREGVVVAGRTGGPTDRRTEWLARLLANVGGTAGRRDGGNGHDTLRDSLLVLRIELLTDFPVAAAALQGAIVALRQGADPSRALNEARNALVVPPSRRPAVPFWGGPW